MGECKMRLNLLTISCFHLVEGIPQGLVTQVLQGEILERNPCQWWSVGVLPWCGADVDGSWQSLPSQCCAQSTPWLATAGPIHKHLSKELVDGWGKDKPPHALNGFAPRILYWLAPVDFHEHPCTHTSPSPIVHSPMPHFESCFDGRHTGLKGF